jgi:filamentous hemagglutinin
MSKKIVRDRISFSKNWTAAIIGSLMAATAQQAQAAGEHSFRTFREQNPDLDRATLRAQFREQRGADRGGNAFVPTVSTTNPAAVLNTENLSARQIRHLERGIDNNRTRNQTFQALEGQLVRVNKGINLDLTSATQNITLGSNLFKDASSITINVGGKDKTVTEGSQVSAAEYVAVKQQLAGGGQKVVLDNQGRATGGDVDLGVLTQGNDTMRASDLVVPVNVTTIGDFGRGSDFRLLGDLTNSGTVLATTSGGRKGSGGALRADDIINQQGGLIQSNVESLLLDASGNLTNAGTISANGNITLQAGNTLTNSGSVSATGDVGINSNNVVNSGSIASTRGNVNFDGADTAALNINNAGGSVSADRGAINFRTEAYTGAFDTNISGGNFLSREFNTHAGQATSYIDVNQLTGTVNQTGAAAHVQAATENLEIGTVCLTGDPTYRNTTGSITVIGNIDVNEALTIIAEGNVTVQNGVSLNARGSSTGYDITLIAGADITGVDGGANIPSIPPGITGSVTINGNASSTGGSVIFGSNTNVNTRTTGGPGNGGNFSVYAFEGATAGSGKVDLGQTIVRTGATVAGTNGSVTIVAGANSGDAITVGELICDQSSFGTGASINITVAQPISSGGSITWNSTGQRITLDNLVAGADVKNGNIVFTGGMIQADDFLIVQAGGDITLTNAVQFTSNLTYLATLGSMTGDATTQVGGSNVYLFAKNNIGSSGTPFVVQASNLNIESSTGSVYVHNELGGVVLTNGDSKAAGDFVLTSAGGMDVESNIIATNISLNALTGTINLNNNGHIVATGNASLTAANAITATGNADVTANELTLSFGSGTTNLNTNVAGLNVTTGATLNIHNAGAITVHDATLTGAFSVDTTAAGLLSVDGDVSATTTIFLSNANGSINLDGDLTAPTVSLSTVGGTGGIDRTSGLITTGGLAITAGDGGAGQTGTLEFTSAVTTTTLSVSTTSSSGASLRYTGTGSIIFLGSSSLIGPLTLAANTASDVTLGAGSNISASHIDINTPLFDLNDRFISGTNGIKISGDTNLVVNGAGGSNLTTSSGPIEFVALNGNLTTNGLLNFSGGDAKMTLQNNNGINAFVNNGTLNGDTTNDLIITAQVYTPGTVTNFANTIVINGNTIVNSTGDVVLPSNLIFNGQDLAIIAAGNITGTLTQINLSSTTGAGGNITIIAGALISPNSGGQIQTASPFTISNSTSSGGMIDLGNTDIITTSSTAAGGKVFLLAFAGTNPATSTISIGNINTTGSTTSGSINILASGNVSVGNVETGAPSKNGVINIAAARAGLTGDIVVTNGVATGLNNVFAEAFAGGSLNLKNLNGNTASLTTSTGSITITPGSLVGLSTLNLATTSGNYVSTGTPSFSVTNANLQSNSGNFTFGLTNITNLVSNVATGTVTVANNAVNLRVNSATGTAQNLVLGSLNFVEILGAVNLGTGNLSATSSSVVQGAISVGGVITANNVTLTAANGGVNLNEFVNGAGTITITTGGANTITQLAGKTITGGNLIIDQPASATTSLALQVASLQLDNAGAFTFVQEGNLELRALTASAVNGTVNNGNVTTAGNITVPDFTLTVDDGSLTLSNSLSASTKATILAQTGINTSGSGLFSTPLLDLEVVNGNIGSNANLLNVDSAELKLNPGASGGIFIGNNNSTSMEISDPITTTGTVRIETDGTLQSGRPISAGNIVLAALDFDMIASDLTATTLIDINKGGNITRNQFGLLNAPQLRLNATSGAVGTSALPFAVAAGTTTISGFGDSVFITSANTTGVALSGGVAGGVNGNFEFKTTGPLTVTGNVTSTNGAVLLQNTAGLLQIGNGVTILGDTLINIINTGSVDEVDKIAIGTGATIKTDFAGAKTSGVGNINIIQGIAADGKVRKNIKNIVQNLQDGGTILFGGAKSSFIAQAPDNIFNAIGANIYISTDQKKADGGLTFGGGVTITADPPVPAGSVVTTYGVRSTAPTVLNVSSDLSQPVNADTANINNVALGNAVNANLTQSQNGIANSLLNLATNNVRLPGLMSDSSDNSYMVSYEPMSLEVDAPVCTDMDFAITGSANQNGTKGIATMKHSDCITLDNGNVLFAPSKDTTVVTPKGTVKIAANSVAMVMVNADHLSVYDINDHHKRSVTVETSGRTIALSPGRHVLLTNKRTGQFAEVNPMEAMMHRFVSTQELGSDKTAFTSEFSLPAAVQVMKPLKAIFGSDNANAKKVAERVLKTSAVLMQVSGNATPFVQHVAPRKVAFN